MSSNSFGLLFVKTKWLLLIFESIRALEIKTSSLFNSDFANYNISLCFFFFFALIIDLYLYWLIPAVITQLFNPIAELVISIGIPTKEAKAEMEMHPVTVSAQYNSQIMSIALKTFLYFLLN